LKKLCLDYNTRFPSNLIEPFRRHSFTVGYYFTKSVRFQKFGMADGIKNNSTRGETTTVCGVALLEQSRTKMPARPSHIPHSNERTALQRMSPAKGLSVEQLYPAGKQTIATMLAKGWIKPWARGLLHHDGRPGGAESADTGKTITMVDGRA
jgi:hypothetical protein